MSTKIEQVNKVGQVVNDFDEKLSIKEIKKCLAKQKSLMIHNNKNPFSVKYRNENFNLCVKNISYLGNPHPSFKKRIQISKEWKKEFQDDSTILLGIYSYKGNTLFCLFDTTTYKNNHLNNSSAHIHVIDLVKAHELGIFQKRDKKNNNITVFTESNFCTAFDLILFRKNPQLLNELTIFNKFSNKLSSSWLGTICYKEMMKANFKDAYQAEWAGFYLEYKFEIFLNENPQYLNYCKYVQHKGKNLIDLDLEFPLKNYVGDLKAHTKGNSLLGNDKNNIELALEKYGKIWYIVFAHETVKDQNMGGVVTRYWNTALNERFRTTGLGKIKDLESYLSRMKYSVYLDHFVVLEINKYNKQYLSDFNQGKNSNQQNRSQKISIRNKDLQNDNFVIYRKQLI